MTFYGGVESIPKTFRLVDPDSNFDPNLDPWSLNANPVPKLFGKFMPIREPLRYDRVAALFEAKV